VRASLRNKNVQFGGKQERGRASLTSFFAGLEFWLAPLLKPTRRSWLPLFQLHPTVCRWLRAYCGGAQPSIAPSPLRPPLPGSIFVHGALETDGPRHGGIAQEEDAAAAQETDGGGA